MIEQEARRKKMVEASTKVLEEAFKLLDDANEVASSWEASRLCRREAVTILARQLANYVYYRHGIERDEALRLILIAYLNAYQHYVG